MNLNLAPYRDQHTRWPNQGRHILAQFDSETVVVYQAYSPAIGLEAARNGRFGSGWSRTRMTWVKPNFLWMMYRCGWATKESQEIVLAIRIARAGFDALLAAAVASSFDASQHATRGEWSEAVAGSDVRLQWDPDHDPRGAPLPRRALQLGLRGQTLARFADEWIRSIDDITPFVREQRAHVEAGPLDALITPAESVYPVSDPQVVAKLGL